MPIDIGIDPRLHLFKNRRCPRLGLDLFQHRRTIRIGYPDKGPGMFFIHGRKGSGKGLTRRNSQQRYANQ